MCNRYIADAGHSRRNTRPMASKADASGEAKFHRDDVEGIWYATSMARRETRVMQQN
jgi:hypothetical protein